MSENVNYTGLGDGIRFSIPDEQKDKDGWLKTKLRALVIGRGSMGRRRIRDLTALGVEVESWDKTDATFIPNGRFDLFLVCTPPDQHAIHGIGPHFVEAGVSQPLVGVHPATDAAGIFPSATPLFTEWYHEMEHGRDHLAYTHWCGQYIQDWHPDATAETYYALRDPSLAIREMVAFELIPITKVYGPVVKAWPVVKRPTFWQIHLDHERGASGSLTIEIESRPAIRHHDTIEMRYSEADYLAEMVALVAAVKGEQPWPYTQEEERANLEVLHMIERSG